MGRIIINGREYSHPVAKFFIKAAALVFAAVVVTLVLGLVLPIVGVAIVSALGIALLAVIIVLLAIPIFIVGGPILAVLITPFAILFRGLFPRTRNDW